MWLNDVIIPTFQIILVIIIIVIIWKFFIPKWLAYREARKPKPLFMTHVQKLRENRLRIEEDFELYRDSEAALLTRINQYYSQTEPIKK